MSINVSSRPSDGSPNSARWMWAGVLTVCSDILATVAQFMPMKSVFILAAGEVPGFFPAFLVSAGPIGAALALVAMAAICALVAKVTQDVGGQLAQPSHRVSAADSRGSITPFFRLIGTLTVRQVSSAFLFFVLVLGSAFVSALYTCFILAWVGISAGILAILVHRSERKPPFPNGLVQLEQSFRPWISGSSLWVVVGGAILTLLISPPFLGLTGILLGAVFLRRVQEVTPDLIPVLSTLLRGNPVDGNSEPPVAQPLKAPYDFLGTDVGSRLLSESLSAMGCETFSWEVCGQPNNTQMTILARVRAEGSYRLIRLFSLDATTQRDHELLLRTEFAKYLVTSVQSVRPATVAGLPALLLNLQSSAHPLPGELTSAKVAGSFQREWEFSCANSRELQERLSSLPVPDPAEFLLPELRSASRIKGPHVQHIKRLIARFSSLREVYFEGPRVISLGGPLRATHLLSFRDGHLEVLDYSRWASRIIGTDWGRSQGFDESPGAPGSSEREGTVSVTALQVGHHVWALGKALRTRAVSHASRLSAELLAALPNEEN